MATLSGGIFCGNCPTICQSAYMNMSAYNPVLSFMAYRIWNGRACSQCDYTPYGECEY